MKENSGQVEVSASQSDPFAERREALARIYRELPVYDSAAFWARLEARRKEEQALPLEVLVTVLRKDAIARGDQRARRRLCEVIVARLQSSNEQWVNRVLASFQSPAGERGALAADLYADLCEQLLRALFNPEVRFWQEQFFHCLQFLRKHVYEGFLRQEGRWRNATPGRGKHVPHTLLESIDRMRLSVETVGTRDVSDERAEQAMLAVEQADFAALVCRLPVKQRAVIWLVFWEDYTIQRVSEVLQISKRTVYKRLAAALAYLRQVLEDEQEVRDGASA